MKKLILASSSPNRKDLLGRLMLPFSCVSPDIDETPGPDEDPEALALRLGHEKALKIAQLHPDAVIIGSDQVCAVGKHIINKPLTHENAMEQWRLLNGQTAVFYTSVVVMKGQAVASAMVPTEVQFKTLPPHSLSNYLLKDKPYDCCAGFKIESLGIALTQWVRSDDPTALIGLPLIQTVVLLEKMGCAILKDDLSV